MYTPMLRLSQWPGTLYCFILQGINNARFVEGRAEKVLRQSLEEIVEGEEVVAVLNPGRGGIGSDTSHCI